MLVVSSTRASLVVGGPMSEVKPLRVGKPVQAALTLPNQLRVKTAVTVPRGGQVDVADLGAQPFRRCPVP